MHDPMLLLNSVIAVVTRAFGARPTTESRRDRGAVSIEQVLWYAAAAISVAVVAAIIWSQIRDTASTPVQSPSAP
jgi:type II secretory pathway component PulK